MRIGLFHARKEYVRRIHGAVGALLDRGHEVVFCGPESMRSSLKPPRSLKGRSGLRVVSYPNGRGDGYERFVRVTRAMRDALRFERPPLRDFEAIRDRALRHLADLLPGTSLEEIESAFAQHPREWDATLARLDGLVPPSPHVSTFIREQELDVALTISRLSFASSDSGVVRAAQALGVPTGYVVWSWDNLSSKGLLHEPPDRLFVWNELQAREAAELHGIDPETVAITGAPCFDDFFELRSSSPRDELLRSAGLDPKQRTVLYLGSSAFIAPEEPVFVDRWLAALRNHPDPMLREANVLLRPHPRTGADPPWDRWEPPDRRVARVESGRDLQPLYDQLAAADAVVALNTSAELEAAIVDRPVLTVDAGGVAPGQSGTLHFAYLLNGAGGYVDHGSTLEEHLGQLHRAVAEDPHADVRRAFVGSFLRPHGVDRPASAVLADAIEELAQVTSPTYD